MKSADLKPSDTISILPLFHNFKNVYDSNDIHKAAAKWIFQHFIKDPDKAALPHTVCGTKEEVREQQGKLATYFQGLNRPLTTYGSDNLIGDVKAKVTSFKQREGMSAVIYSDALCKMKLRNGCVNEE